MTGSTAARKLAIAAAFVVAPASAMAADRTVTTLWMIEDRGAAGETREVRRGDFVFKQRLLPTGLAELEMDPASPQVAGLADGMQLVELQSREGLVFCDPVIRPQKLIGHGQRCLVDGDRDGRFEGLFLTTSVTKGILTIQGKRPKAPRAVGPIAYRRVDPTEFKTELFVALEYRGNANPLGNHVFEINFGSAERTGSLTGRLIHKKGDIPGSKEVMGGRFTILETTPDGLRVRIDKPLPSQPFGVIQTTTYRIY